MLLNCGVGEDSWESLGLQGDPTSPSQRRSVLGVHWKDWCWSWHFSTLAAWWKSWLIRKDPDAGRDWGQEEKGTTEDEMDGWHHWLNGHGFGWTPGVGNGQGGLACCGSWGHRVGHNWATELNWNELNCSYSYFYSHEFILYKWLEITLVLLPKPNTHAFSLGGGRDTLKYLTLNSCFFYIQPFGNFWYPRNFCRSYYN